MFYLLFKSCIYSLSFLTYICLIVSLKHTCDKLALDLGSVLKGKIVKKKNRQAFISLVWNLFLLFLLLFALALTVGIFRNCLLSELGG